MSRNIISISYLDLDGFRFVVENNNLSILRRDIFYGNGCLMNGLYILNIESSYYKFTYNIKVRNLNQMF